MKRPIHRTTSLLVVLVLFAGSGCTERLTGPDQPAATDHLDAFVVTEAAGNAALTPVPAALDRVRLEGELSATSTDPLASGKAKYEARTDRNRSRFSTEVEDVSVDGEGEVVVSRDGTELMRATISIVNGFGDLNMSSRRDDIPEMLSGDLVEVYNADGVLILSGTLATK
ncbi:MAG: hypothetical protein D6746_14925 [Bacteroidetes bacterium]|nr:MAG: hypothetical protein D6746_14925 [Bacteroidota bacterium]